MVESTCSIVFTVQECLEKLLNLDLKSVSEDAYLRSIAKLFHK